MSVLQIRKVKKLYQAKFMCPDYLQLENCSLTKLQMSIVNIFLCKDSIFHEGVFIKTILKQLIMFFSFLSGIDCLFR